MNNPSRPRSAAPSRRRSTLQISPIAAAVSTLLLAPLAAQAQSTQASQQIVVTGIRAAIESSVAAKRNADSIVEVVTSEDIGKLPDVSIAESLARLPGLAGQRVGGRTQSLQIRGLSQDFSVTLLNGREQVSTGDNRAVEFDQFPSELISKVRVYKTPDAGLVAQGVSGTVNMESIRPLDLRGRALALNARYEDNSNGSLTGGISGNGKRFSVSYIDQFADRTVGIALGYAHLDSPGQELHYKAWGFGTLNADCTAHPEWGCSQATGVPAGATIQNGWEGTAISRKQQRDGLMAVLEYKPNKSLHSVVDLYYSKFTKDESMAGLMNGLAEGWSGNPGIGYSNVGTTQVGDRTLVTSANIANTNFIVRNDLNARDDKILAGGWNTKARFGDNWSATADLAYSRAERKEDVIETYAGARRADSTASNGSTQVYGSAVATIPTGPAFGTFVPGLNYADAQQIYLSDPAHDWGHDGLWKKPRAKDEMSSLRMEVSRTLGGAFSVLDVGVTYTDRQKDREMNEVEAKLNNNRRPVLVPGSLVQEPTSLAHVGVPGVLTYDVMGALNSLYTLTPTALNEIINRNYEVSEKVTTGYAKVGIDTQWGSVPVRGNIGIQFVHTDQSSHGYSKFGSVTPTNQPSENSRGTTYDDVLPSVNLNFDVGPSTVLRLGLAKTLSRARMDDMRAGADVSLNATTGLWGGSGGNPYLQPWRAKSFDLSVEHYLSKSSYVAAAAFYKTLDSYIYNRKTEVDFTGIPNTTAIVPRSSIGEFTGPVNGNGGQLSGVELTAVIDGGMWVKALDGFGISGSATYIDTNIHPNGPGTSEKLPGLSDVTANLTVFYEKSGFQVRVSQRYRSAYRGEVNSLHNSRGFTQIQADRQTDAQIGYEFQSGPAKGLAVLLQVNNLTDSPYVTKHSNGFTEEYNKYGRQVLLGVNFKL